MITEVRAGKLVFEHALVMGAGCCKTLADIVKASTSAVSGMELGTISKKMLSGNQGDNFYAHFVRGVLIFTQNSLGMPNPGKDAVEAFAKEAIAIAHAHNKLIGINVAGDTPDELIEMVRWAVGLGFDWITINPACPNKFIDGNPASIFYYDMSDVRFFLRELDGFLNGHDTEIWWKMTPDNNTLDYQLKMVDLVSKCSAVTGLVANNTVPHTLAYDAHFKPSITMRFGGMGGPAVMPKALADIARFKERFGDRFVLVGAGGCTYGKDILDFQHAGADIIQATSAYWASGMNLQVYGDILSEYIDLLNAG